MIRKSFLFGLSLALLLPLAACDSSTDVSSETVQGQWDGVGALQASFPEVRLELLEDASGSIAGTWRRGGQAGMIQGTNQAGQVSLQLSNFEVGTVLFQGRFTNRYRLEGDLQGATLSGPAVFRRIRF
jgi:hypothetical protein